MKKAPEHMGMEISLPIGGRRNVRAICANMRMAAEKRGVKLINWRRYRVRDTDGPPAWQNLLIVNFDCVPLDG